MAIEDNDPIVVDVTGADGGDAGPAPETDFDDPGSVQAAIARAAGGDETHPRPTVKSRRATPRSARPAVEPPVETPAPAAADDEGEDGGEPDEPAAGVQEPLSEDIKRVLQLHHLPIREGETGDQALERVRNHERVRWQKHDQERRQLERRVAAQEQQLANIATLEPLLRAFAEEKIAAQREREMAARPDPETDPERYDRSLLESLHERMSARERAEASAAEEQRRLEAENQRISAIVDYDDETVDELERAVADPAVKQAYEYLSALGYEEVAEDYPEATPEQVREFVSNSQLIQLRGYRQKGWNIGDLLLRKAQRAYQRGLAIYGQATAGAPGAPAGNGNGNGKPAKPAAQGSPTAQRIQREHAQSQARAAVSGGSRAGGPSGTALDLTRITDPDELVSLMKAGKITEYMIQSQLGIPART